MKTKNGKRREKKQTKRTQFIKLCFTVASTRFISFSMLIFCKIQQISLHVYIFIYVVYREHGKNTMQSQCDFGTRLILMVVGFDASIFGGVCMFRFRLRFTWINFAVCFFFVVAFFL